MWPRPKESPLIPRHLRLPWVTGALLLGLVWALPGCKSTTSARRPDARVAPLKAAPPSKPDPFSRPATFPIIDSHVHITPLEESFNTALYIFSRVGIKKFAVKSAGKPGSLRYRMSLKFAEILGRRMAFFTNVDWDGVDDPGWGKREANRLEQAVRQGARGIKIFKALGLGVRLNNDKLLRVDDPRLDPIWRRAGKLGAIIAWHVADPVAFFKKPDKNNERWDELKLAEDWSFYGKDYPSHAELLAARDRVIARHPKTIFLGIHLANYPENLDYVAKVLDRFPNLHVDTSARVPEFGRHPAAKVRAFFIKYQDRIMFGSDLIVTPRGMQLGSVSADERPPSVADAVEFYAAHRRYFETTRRQIAHPTPIQGRWKVNAINLPPEVLRKLYHDNADKLIFEHRRQWLKQHATKKKKK